MGRAALVVVMGMVGCASAQPVAPEPEPARPEPALDVPPAAPATLGVNDMAGHPARWNEETIVLFARLRYDPGGAGQWLLVDAEDEDSLTVVLEPMGAEVPAACIEPVDGQTPAVTPCQPLALDLDARYRLEGRPIFDRTGSRFEATGIEHVPDSPD